MESTGLYWIPLQAVLEGAAEAHLVNPLFIKYLPGRKTEVHESAGKTRHGHITKRGSKHLRTALIEAAHVIARGGPKLLNEFFQRF